MYSRPSSRDFRVPSNYGGSAFRDNTPTQAQDLTRRQSQYREDDPPMSTPDDKIHEHKNEEYDNNITDDQTDRCEDCPKCAQTQECGAPDRSHVTQNSLFSPIGALGSEEILLIALALIIFQSGKEPELALILLALLFIN